MSVVNCIRIGRWNSKPSVHALRICPIREKRSVMCILGRMLFLSRPEFCQMTVLTGCTTYSSKGARPVAAVRSDDVGRISCGPGVTYSRAKTETETATTSCDAVRSQGSLNLFFNKEGIVSVYISCEEGVRRVKRRRRRRSLAAVQSVYSEKGARPVAAHQTTATMAGVSGIGLSTRQFESYERWRWRWRLRAVVQSVRRALQNYYLVARS